ncbi:MAG: ABC transporter permease [Lachnospiraceae bacterium]|nr:ABC transporter permease [Lachnospiraceae bacterium]
MFAIYKRELKSYMTSMFGYVFMAVNLLFAGIYFNNINIQGGSPYFGYTLSYISFLFMFTIPLVTMRMIADEKKQKTDQLLLTSPVTITRIVLGKYLAVVTVFAIPVLLYCVYPLIMGRFGSIPYKMTYSSILAYFLIGCAFIAIGMFISSLTDSVVIAAFISLVVFFFMYMEQTLASFIPKTAISSVIGYTIVIIAIVAIIYYMTSNAYIAGIVGIIAETALLIIYMLKPVKLEGSISYLLNAFDITSGFANFLNGIFDIKALIYYISIIVICFTLTVQMLQKRRWS